MTTKPVDLAAFVGDEEPEPFRFLWDGETYELPGILPMSLAVKFEDPAHAAEALVELFGADQWERLTTASRVFGEKAYRSMMLLYGKHLGMPEGELEASFGSLQTKPARSRRTSNGSTGSRSRASAARR